MEHRRLGQHAGRHRKRRNALTPSPSHIETGRWYDLKLVVTGKQVKCWLDGQLMHDVDYENAGQVSSPLCLRGARSIASGDLIVKVVNASATPLATPIDLADAKNLTGTGTATVLTSENPGDENSLAEPTESFAQNGSGQFFRGQPDPRIPGKFVHRAAASKPANNLMSTKYTIGLDYGTNSVRALIVNVANGAEVAAAVWTYAHGTQGVILSRDPNLARQHPADYLEGAAITIKQALATAKKIKRDFRADQIIGIGVDTTGSTPLPVDANGQPLALQKKFAKNPAAMAWLWKDHTGVHEAAEITALAQKDPSAIPRQMRRHLFQRMVLQQGSEMQTHRARKCSTPRIPGWNLRILFPPP